MYMSAVSRYSDKLCPPLTRRVADRSRAFHYAGLAAISQKGFNVVVSTRSHSSLHVSSSTALEEATPVSALKMMFLNEKPYGINRAKKRSGRPIAPDYR
jgi:hypothetical protein